MAGIKVIDATAQNTINFSVSPGSTAGTTADGSASTISYYRITCNAASGSTSYPAVTKTYTKTQTDATACVGTAATDAAGCAFGGLSLTTYTCTIVPVNTEGLEGPAFTTASVTVA